MRGKHLAENVFGKGALHKALALLCSLALCVSFVLPSGQAIAATASAQQQAPAAAGATANPVKAAIGATGAYGYGIGELAATLDIELPAGASVSAYRWYTCDEDGTKTSRIAGADEASYAIPVGRAVGTYPVVCDVTIAPSDGVEQTYTSPVAIIEVVKGAAQVTLGAPESVTADGATFPAAVATLGADTVQYGYADSNDASAVTSWQDSLVFTGVDSSVNHWAFAQVAGTDDYEGATSAGRIFSSNTVTFYKMNGNYNSTTASVCVGSVVDASLAPAVSKCEGWYTDAACTDGKEFNFSTPVSTDTTVYAKWVSSPVSVMASAGAAGEYGKTGVDLSASAPCTGGASVTGYQWYELADGATEGTPVEGATQAGYTVPKTTKPGSHSFYCVVTATAGGTQVSNRSNTVVATIAAASSAAMDMSMQAVDLSSTGFTADFTVNSLGGLQESDLEYAVGPNGCVTRGHS